MAIGKILVFLQLSYLFIWGLWIFWRHKNYALLPTGLIQTGIYPLQMVDGATLWILQKTRK